MTFPRAFLALVLLAAVRPDQEKGASLEETIKSHEKFLKSIEGVKEIAPDPTPGPPTILIRVDTQKARDSVALLMGEKLGEYPLRVLLSTTPIVDLDPGKAGETGAPPGDLGCTHCPLHCPHAHVTMVDPTPLPTPAPPKGGPPGTETQTSWDRCDVARKWLNLPRRSAPPGGACEVMVSWSDDPVKIKWAVEQRLPHWRSKDMPGLVGSDKHGVDCPEHGKHPVGETICYTWIKHNPQCPLFAIVAPKDLLSPANVHLEAPKINR